MNDSEQFQIAAAFYSDADPNARSRALQILSDCNHENADALLVSAMDDGDEKVWRTAAEILKFRYPWLRLRPSLPQTLPDQVLLSANGKKWKHLFSTLQNHLANHPFNGNFERLNRWQTLPGAVPDLIEILQTLACRSEADYLSKAADPYGEFQQEHLQILMAPTYACNLDCPYCYAKGWHSSFKDEMSLGNLETAFAWCAEQGVDRVVLCGGEPTVYRKFSTLLEYAERWKLRLSLTTNLLYSDEVKDLIDPDSVAEIIAHYDQTVLLYPQKADRFNENLRSAGNKFSTLYLRYTLSRTSTAEQWRPLIETALKFGIQWIHYAFAFQNIFKNNESVDYQTQNRESNFAKIFDAFVSDCFSAGLKLHLCKPIPLCAFSDTALNDYLSMGVLRSACGAYLRNGTQNITINPDLSTFPCNAIGVRGPSILRFKTLKEVSRYYQPGIRKLLFAPYDNACNTCFYYYQGFCQGVCLAEKYSLMPTNRKENVFKSNGQ